MKRLLKNGSVVNVFTGEIRRENILIGDDIIIAARRGLAAATAVITAVK